MCSATKAKRGKLLGDIDPKSLDLALGGQVAFVQSILLTTIDPKKAVALLDLARLLMPGGLVEEAALRREVFAGRRCRARRGQIHDARRTISGRFPQIALCRQFPQSFTATVIRLRLAEDVDNFPKLERMTETLGARRSARAVSDGRTRGAGQRQASRWPTSPPARRLTLAAADSPDEARGRLYQAAARTLTDQYDSALALLQALDAKKLAKRDVALLAAARNVAKRIREKPPTPSATPPAIAANRFRFRGDPACRSRPIEIPAPGKRYSTMTALGLPSQSAMQLAQSAAANAMAGGQNAGGAADPQDSSAFDTLLGSFDESGGQNPPASAPPSGDDSSSPTASWRSASAVHSPGSGVLVALDKRLDPDAPEGARQGSKKTKRRRRRRRSGRRRADEYRLGVVAWRPRGRQGRVDAFDLGLCAALIRRRSVGHGVSPCRGQGKRRRSDSAGHAFGLRGDGRGAARSLPPPRRRSR